MAWLGDWCVRQSDLPDPISLAGARDFYNQKRADALGLAGGGNTEWRVDAAWLARECSGLVRLYGHGNGPVDLSGVCFTVEESRIMANFVRDNPEAPLLAMYKHLEISKRLRPAEPNAEDMFALTVFHAAVTAALAYERVQAAEAAARDFAETPAAAWPGEQAFKVQDPAFAPTGFSPR